jgi:hypothetical protein
MLRGIAGCVGAFLSGLVLMAQSEKPASRREPAVDEYHGVRVVDKHRWLEDNRVDNRAQIQMRGDTISIRTLEGSKGRDDGSECTQAMPYSFVSGFAIRQTAERNRVTLDQEPSRTNNYTAKITIDDPQCWSDSHLAVGWRVYYKLTGEGRRALRAELYP